MVGKRRGLARFVAAALPKAPVCALKLGDRISSTGVLRGMVAGLSRALSSNAAAPPVRLGGLSRHGPTLRIKTAARCCANPISPVNHFPPYEKRFFPKTGKPDLLPFLTRHVHGVYTNSEVLKCPFSRFSIFPVIHFFPYEKRPY
jgi:hypothetical protein